MNIADYPVQGPLAEFGQKHYMLMARRNAQLLATEYAYLPESPLQSLLFYRAVSARAPLLLFFHGGGWTNGYKEYAAFMGPLFALLGISFATVGYRLAPEHVFPAGWDDCAAAVRWCRDNGTMLDVSPDGIFVGGFSAGAHYASLLATRQDWQAPRGLPLDIVKGCLPISGSYRFGEGAGFAARPRFLGAEEQRNESAASPINHVGAHCPPFYIAWGEWDFPHLVSQAREFAAALRARGVAVNTLELPERDHLGAGLAAGEIQGPWFASARAWIESQCERAEQ